MLCDKTNCVYEIMTKERWLKPESNVRSFLADKKGGMIGAEMGKIYSNYFENQEVLNYFNFALDEIDDKKIQSIETILEIGANAGIVGESVKHYLESKEIKANLIISDINRETLLDNKNPDTLKVVFDNRNMATDTCSFELVLARSVTHYETTRDQEKTVLEEVKRVLTPGGFFIDQAPTALTNEEAELWKNIHALIDKPMNVQTQEKVIELLEEVFNRVHLAKKQPPLLHADQDGFIRRYKINNKEEIIKKIQELIRQVGEEKRPHIKATPDGFEWDVPFTVFICEK